MRYVHGWIERHDHNGHFRHLATPGLQSRKKEIRDSSIFVNAIFHRYQLDYSTSHLCDHPFTASVGQKNGATYPRVFSRLNTGDRRGRRLRVVGISATGILGTPERSVGARDYTESLKEPGIESGLVDVCGTLVVSANISYTCSVTPIKFRARPHWITSS